MKLTPTRNLLLVSQMQKATVSSGGITLLTHFNDDRMQWRVEAVGPKVREVQVGDHIITPMNYGFVKLDDGRAFIPEGDVLSIITDPARTNPEIR